MRVRTASLKKTSRPFIVIIALFAMVLTLAGCDLTRNSLKMDRSGNKEFQDYRDAFAPRLPEPTDTANGDNGGNIPSLQSYVAPPSEKLKAMPLVSISVNQTVPLRDALFELAKQANYDIELDPRISGSIIFVAREQPLDIVVQRISDIAGLRYKFDGQILRIQLDTPYSATYKIDYLSYIRKNSSSVKNDISLADTGGGGSGGANTGSSFSATSEGTADFWGELQANLQQILGVPVGAGEMKTSADPQITVVAPNPAPVAPAGAAGGTGAAAGAAASTGAATNSAPAPSAAAPQATLQVSSLPPASGGAAAPASTPSFALNKQAGIISVYANERQHTQVRNYLKQLRRAVTAQVLIEAKVMEVSLTDEFSAGINWNQIIQSLGGRIQLNPGKFAIPSNLGAGAPFSLSVAANGANVETAVFSAVQRFGTVKALANPRLTVLNNQSAVLNVALNRVYFSVTATVTPGTATTAGTTNVTSTAHSVPEGVLINVQPSIDLERKTIAMSVRPTVTRIVDSIDDPGVSLLNIPGVTSGVPEVNVQELDSVINMDSGQAVLMGGLMQDRTDSARTGAPILSEVPVVGAAFRNKGDKVQKTELVIMLKATILDDGEGAQDDTDRDMYRTFSDDRHPFRL